MIDAREHDHDYGDIWQELCRMPIGKFAMIRGIGCERKGPNEFVVGIFYPETTSCAGAVELLLGRFSDDYA